MHHRAPTRLALALLATVSLLSACSTTKEPVAAAPAPETAAPAVQAVAPAPATVVTPAPAAAQQSVLSGKWEGKWSIDGVGLEGKTVLAIEGVDGDVVTGKATMFDTPYGDVTEAFAPATLNGNKLTVKHSNGATYTLTLTEKDGKQNLRGPLTYVTEAGTYNGTIKVTKK